MGVDTSAEIQGVAAWLAQRKGTEAFAADLKLLINLTRPAAIVPYVGGGAGLYRGHVRAARAVMPAFYQRRAGDPTRTRSPLQTPPRSSRREPTCTSRAISRSGRSLAMRIVTNSSQTYRVTTVTFGLTYHVEEHEGGASP